MNMFKILFYISVSLILFSCSEEEEKKPEINWSKEQSTNMNREFAVQEEIDIRVFLEMHKDWRTVKTGSGLQYYIYHQGVGSIPFPGEEVEIEYTISLLDGTECYKTKADEYEVLVVDKSEIETGVQEALKIMKEGDKAKLIVPSHIGHGLIGDMDKIPPLTTLIIDLHLLKIRK